LKITNAKQGWLSACVTSVRPTVQTPVLGEKISRLKGMKHFLHSERKELSPHNLIATKNELQE
jgi:hypothetical protein